MSKQAVQRLAVLVDGDNVSTAHASAIVDFADHLSEACSYTVFGGLKPNCRCWWASALEAQCVNDLRVVRNVLGKNGADMRMAIAGVDLYYQGAADGFLLVTHDVDLLPLVEQLKQLGQPVFGCATNRVSQRLRAAVDAFYELPHAPSLAKASNVPAGAQRSEAIRSLLDEGIRKFTAGNGWLHLHKLAEYLTKRSAGYAKNKFGHRSLSKLLERHGFEVVKKKGAARTRVAQTTAQALAPTNKAITSTKDTDRKSNSETVAVHETTSRHSDQSTAKQSSDEHPLELDESVKRQLFFDYEV